MRWTSILAIYLLFSTLALFVVLPFGVRTSEEAGVDKLPGQADSAPHDFRLGRAFLLAGLVGAVLTASFVLNYIYGWLTIDQLDWLHR